jgi:hypothetical protein
MAARVASITSYTCAAEHAADRLVQQAPPLQGGVFAQRHLRGEPVEQLSASCSSVSRPERTPSSMSCAL